MVHGWDLSGMGAQQNASSTCAWRMGPSYLVCQLCCMSNGLLAYCCSYPGMEGIDTSGTLRVSLKGLS